MKSSTTYLCLHILLLASLAACGKEAPPSSSAAPSPEAPVEPPTEEPPAPRMIQPGETTVPLGALKVSDESDLDPADADCENPDCIVVFDLCRVMAPFPTSLAIVEYQDLEYVEIDINDCSDHHPSDYGRVRLKTLGVVAGEAVPEELTATTYALLQSPPLPVQGDTFLVSLYEINGEWFSAYDYTVKLGEEVVVEDTQDEEITIVLDVPMSFEGLVEEAEAILADYEPCRSRSWTFWTSREKIHDFLATPGIRCGGSDLPEDMASSEDSQPAEERSGVGE